MAHMPPLGVPLKKFAILVLGAALLLGACSSGSTASSKSTDSSTTTAGSPSGTAVSAKQLEVAVRAYVNAFIKGDTATAHELYSVRCQKDVSPKDLAAFMKSTSKGYSGVTLSNYSAKITGDRASVEYGMSNPSLSRSNQRWVVENGTWRTDEC